MAEELMLKVEDVYKKYRLGLIGGGTLTADLQSWWAKVRHKEDPNSKIGAKTYGKNEVFYALNGISFEVKKGEALGIIGGNGAGKSTTLKLISQVTAPTKGKIYINGRITSMLEVGTGFHPELTGRENIYLNGAILGMKKAEIDNKIEEIIDFSECRQFIDTPVKRYSSGMYVKLAFSVASHLDSEIMIMDEVLAVGDMTFQKKCIDKMKSIANDEGRTILYVSHNMNTIRKLCDRCIVMDKGKVIFEGNVEKAIELYMGTGKEDLKSTINLETQKRESRATLDVKIKEVEIKNEKCCVDKGDVLDIKVSMSCVKDISNVYLRTTVFSADERVIGMTTTEATMNFSKGENCQKEFLIKVGCLVPGRYRLKMVLYRFNGIGTEEFLDIVENGCYFDVIDVKNSYGIDWVANWWGNVSFDKTVIK